MTLQERVATLALKVEKAMKGSDVQSDLFARATFEAWGKTIVPRRTMADWLSHDPVAVDLYLDDPLCGWSPTVSMAEDLIALVAQADHGVRVGLPPALPVHLLGGTADPATAQGTALSALADKLRLSGTRDLTLALVEGARHETLRESEPYRGAGIASFSAWLDRILSRDRRPPEMLETITL
jgi:alpha-beta hydrolase superfamily lysophospholipase